MSNILVETYRPIEMEDLILDESVKQRINDMIASPNEKLPHLLFIGKAGTGKSTLAKIISKKTGFNTLTINSSDDRGIQVVRDKIKVFAQTSDDKLRLIILEEFDGTTGEFQQALRNLMETYSRTCRFIATANYKHKIIEPLTSRMCAIEFKTPDKEKIYQRVMGICKKENIQFEEEALKEIVNKEYPDIRKTINSVQMSVKDGKITKQTLVQHIKLFDEIWVSIQAKKLTEIRQLIADNNVNFEDLYSDIFERIFVSKIDDKIKAKIFLYIAERLYRNSYIADEEINFIAFLQEFWGVM